MERKYFYARAVGSPHVVLQNIIAAVEKSGLASLVPLVKIERRARKEFYVFLAVDDENSRRIPGELGQTFQFYGIKFDEDNPLTPAEIKSMAQRQQVEIHGFNALQYRRREFLDPGDPFDQSDAWEPQEVSLESCDRFELLLHWLSAYGEGSWTAFKLACDALGVTNLRQDARSALRRLSLLGHIETSADGLRWSVSPACLVRFPDNPISGFLSGQRTKPFLHRVGEDRRLNKKHQSFYAGPPRVVLDSSVINTADQCADIGIVDAGITSTRLADFLPDLNEWKDSLQSLTSLRTAPYHIERWVSGSFHPCDTVFERDGVYYGETGMYRLSREADTTGRTMTTYFDEPAQRWLRGDWYGLRFLSLEAEGSYAHAVHDTEAGILLVPSTQRWPLLHERALTLASGLLPGRATNPDWLSYSNVPLDLARTLCGKLRVRLQEK